MVVEPVNVTELGKEKFKEFLDSFDYVFSDCDGVIWFGTPLPGSGEFFKLMRKHGKKIHFVSNNSSRTKEDYEAMFKSVEIENGYENLTIPSIAIAEYLKSVNMNKKVYCVTSKGTMRVLESYGYQCEYGPDVGVDSYHDYVQYLEDDTEIGAVVFDSDFKVNLPKLYKAITYLKRPEVHFVSGATDRDVALKPGVTGLGVEVFTDLVAEETKRERIQLGKPGKMFGHFVMKRAGASDPSRVLFIGDMITQDVGIGKAMGFKTLLVLTNTTKENMLSQTDLRPDYYAPSLGSIVPLLN